MITPGWMPSYRARGPRKVMSYVRVRKRAKKPRGLAGPTREEIAQLALASGSVPLPAARVRVRGLSPAGVAASFVGWLGAQARWLRPRALPGVIAFAGLCGIMSAMSYLAKVPAATVAATVPARPPAPVGYNLTKADMSWQRVVLGTPAAAVAPTLHSTDPNADW